MRQLVQAHAYWRLKGLAVDLVIWNEDRGGYRQVLQDQIMGLIAAGVEAHVIDRPGGIFVRRARADLGRGPHPAPVGGARHHHRPPRAASSSRSRAARRAEVRVPRLVPTRSHRGEAPARAEPPARDLILANGLGGFTPDGSEYVITTLAGETTPAPWVNVLANPHFGTRDLGERASPTRGARTRTNSASRRGTTIRSAMRAARRSTCATRRPGTSGRPRRCRAAAPAPTSRATASATASSSTARMASLGAVRLRRASTRRSSSRC